jgi:hypothetical protein
VFNSSLGSSIASGAHDEISEYFHIPSESIEMVLPTSLYMAGFAIGMSDEAQIYDPKKGQSK